MVDHARNSPLDHLLVDLLPVLRVSVCAHLGVETLERDPSHVHTTPHGHWGGHTHTFNTTDFTFVTHTVVVNVNDLNEMLNTCVVMIAF